MTRPSRRFAWRCEGEGRDQVIRFETNVDDEVTVDAAHPLRFVDGTGHRRPQALCDWFVPISRRWSAGRCSTTWSAAGTVEEGWFGVWSSGRFFPMQTAAEIGLAS